jgi:hypothetical protein
MNRSYTLAHYEHVTARLRAALVDAVLGERAARAFCARVVGQAVERAVGETTGK